MAVNKLALIRYKTIDDCLKNRYRKWTLEDLIEKVSATLYELEGITTGVSKRTIQADIQLMRSDKLGYNAPIVVKDKRFYAYEDSGFSITKAPINNADVDKMKEIVGVLKQFNAFNYFDEMSDMIARLENNLYKSTKQSGNNIQLESNKLVKGLECIPPLYQAVLNKRSLLIEYKSFKAQQSQQGIYYPYLLKEYRNRWFLICKAKKRPGILNLALDRIVEFQELPNEEFVSYQGVDFDRYYEDLIGVTKSERDRAQKVILEFTNDHAPYVVTKPMHQSQVVLSKNEKTTTFRIDVVLNYELEREILGFGECVKVLSPRLLISKIKRRLAQTYEQYESVDEEKVFIKSLRN
ncbi:WYL domain-containing protein [Pedobacter sp. ISL-68]|uniref:helix-turn-helix transcriptional regulator n=1 Tax=unclassified Pedobacter TaxID=2628915 RepID=UPI001BEB5700|nr:MULTISPECIES: WYL domain-containing protein [unclassified Pedobacter]MBT2562239.1 WYL domain-containing protein [Pedobacter sp. ISL-64]MBT2588990.1 WYL domain-containing protein [Pedobacter sp. ISL-68]